MFICLELPATQETTEILEQKETELDDDNTSDISEPEDDTDMDEGEKTIEIVLERSGDKNVWKIISHEEEEEDSEPEELQADISHSNVNDFVSEDEKKSSVIVEYDVVSLQSSENEKLAEITEQDLSSTPSTNDVKYPSSNEEITEVVMGPESDASDSDMTEVMDNASTASDSTVDDYVLIEQVTTTTVLHHAVLHLDGEKMPADVSVKEEVGEEITADTPSTDNAAEPEDTLDMEEVIVQDIIADVQSEPIELQLHALDIDETITDKEDQTRAGVTRAIEDEMMSNDAPSMVDEIMIQKEDSKSAELETTFSTDDEVTSGDDLVSSPNQEIPSPIEKDILTENTITKESDKELPEGGEFPKEEVAPLKEKRSKSYDEGYSSPRDSKLYEVKYEETEIVIDQPLHQETTKTVTLDYIETMKPKG